MALLFSTTWLTLFICHALFEKKNIVTIFVKGVLIFNLDQKSDCSLASSSKKVVAGCTFELLIFIKVTADLEFQALVMNGKGHANTI